jgi:hypothetical protein
MIHVRMRENHRVDFLGIKSERRILFSGFAALALEKPTVEEDALSADDEFMARSGDFASRAMRDQTHRIKVCHRTSLYALLKCIMKNYLH